METFEISAEVRTGTGKGGARKLRAAGRVPGVLYGMGEDATSIAVDPVDLERLRRQPLGFNTPLTLTVDGLSGTRLVMIKDMQRHPVSRKMLHVDFWNLDAEKKVEVPVELVTVGKAPGVELGGRLQVMRRSINVRCAIVAIPSEIEFDISELELGDKVYVDDLTMPEGVEALYEERFPVMAVIAKGVDEDEADEEEGDEEALEEGEGDAEDSED
jgi:large subunit ribosomal protein L25